MDERKVAHQHKVGDVIEARDPHSGTWRQARVREIAPYRHRPHVTPGYYVRWLDVTASWESSGGWTAEHCTRRIEG